MPGDMAHMLDVLFTLDYTNYKGERKNYVIRPIRWYYGNTIHHPVDQWLLKALKENGIGQEPSFRDFAFCNIHSLVRIEGDT